MSAPRELSEHEIRMVAATASLDPRTVRRLLQGVAARSPATIRALAAALRRMKLSAHARHLEGAS